MPEMFSAPCQSVAELGPRQVRVSIDVADSAVRASHSVPGQYVNVAFGRDDVPRPYAIASKPGAAVLELLIKTAPERRSLFLGMQPGDRISLSSAQGKGYPTDALVGRHVWLIGAGTGIAPLRSWLEAALDRRTAFGELTVVYGARTPNELAFQERFATWAGMGVKVVPVISQPDGTGWAGATGHVQGQLPTAFSRPAQTSVLLCGMPEMDRATSAALLALGVGPDQIHRNW
jgi:sulfhydrogenase subunit gamma (sulfur reductase)